MSKTFAIVTLSICLAFVLGMYFVGMQDDASCQQPIRVVTNTEFISSPCNLTQCSEDYKEIIKDVNEFRNAVR